MTRKEKQNTDTHYTVGLPTRKVKQIYTLYSVYWIELPGTESSGSSPS